MRPSLVRSVLALLIVLAVPAGAVERLGSDVRPTFQTVDLRIDPAETRYAGTVRIELEPAVETRSLRLHSEGQTLESVRLVDRGTGREIPIEHRVDEPLLVVESSEILRIGRQLVLEIAFEADLGAPSVGLYRVEHGEDAYVASQFQADDAREAFPCFDEPGFKIPWRIAVEVPAGHEAISNAPIAFEEELEGRRRVVFEQTPPLPSYLVAVAVGPWETVPVPDLGVPARIVVPRGMAHLADLAVSTTGPILRDLEEWFGTPYPFRKLDQIAVPDFAYGAMENPGAVTYRDDLLLLDPETVSADERAQLARVVAHELAHMWFGDLVTMQWWDDLWLNESFADWMADASAQRVFPELGIGLASLRATEGTMNRDALPGTRAIRGPVDSIPQLLEIVGLAYGKGKRILSMVEGWVGPEVFRDGVRSYLAEHAWGNTTGDDLWSALSATAERDVSTVLRSFLDQPGLPLVTAELDGDRVLVLRQERYAGPGAEVEPRSWEIPVALKLGRADGTVERTVLLSDTPLRVPLSEPVEWIFPHAGARGWYRWSIPAPMLSSLADAGPEALEPAERIALLGNALTLLESGELGADRYLPLIRDFGSDPHPEVVRTALDGLARVRRPLVNASSEEDFASFVRTAFGPTLDRIGRTPRPEEPETVERLRPVLLTWLGLRGRDPEVLELARREAEAFVEARELEAPSLLGTTLPIAARDGDRALFEALRERLTDAASPAERGRILEALGAFRDPRLRPEILRFALEGPLRPQEVLPLAGGLAEEETAREDLLEWALAHFDDLTWKVPPPHLLYLPMVAAGCSPGLVDRAREGFGALEMDERLAAGLARRLDRAEESVVGCLALRRLHGEDAARWLATAAAG